MNIQESFLNNKATLYLVSTPIGNLLDITYRAVSILKEVDIIFCEDTRHSKVLLDEYGINNKKLYSYQKFNETEMVEKAIKILSNNQNICLISDAGTPGINDPGYLIAKYVIDNGYNVVSVPGASAVLAGLIQSGLVVQPFTYIGFLPRKKEKIKKELNDYKYRKETLVIYESPLRVLETLKIIYEVLGNRKSCLLREMTKKYETIYRGDLVDILDNIDNINFKGEFVIIIEGISDIIKYKDVSLEEHMNIYMKQGYTEKESLKLVSVDLNISKKEVYRRYKLEGKDEE